jgi:hypothetical protein
MKSTCSFCVCYQLNLLCEGKNRTRMKTNFSQCSSEVRAKTIIIFGGLGFGFIINIKVSLNV